MNSAQLINQTSGDVEYYTPPFIIEAARAVMGGIDLDPFSSAAANERVKADRFFTPMEDGFAQDWFGRLWMNHPFGKLYNKRAIAKLDYSVREGLVDQACCITYACTSERWFQPLLGVTQCFLCPRTDYYLPDGTKKRGVTKGSVVSYYGPHTMAFVKEFGRHGKIKIEIA